MRGSSSKKKKEKNSGANHGRHPDKNHHQERAAGNSKIAHKKPHDYHDFVEIEPSESLTDALEKIKVLEIKIGLLSRLLS